MNNLSIEILQSRLALLETYWKEYMERHQQLFAHRGALKDEDYFTQDIYSDAEGSYIKTKSKLPSMLSEQIGAIRDSCIITIVKIVTVQWQAGRVGYFQGNLLFPGILTCVDGKAVRRLSNFQLIGSNFVVAW